MSSAGWRWNWKAVQWVGVGKPGQSSRPGQLLNLNRNKIGNSHRDSASPSVSFEFWARPGTLATWATVAARCATTEITEPHELAANRRGVLQSRCNSALV